MNWGFISFGTLAPKFLESLLAAKGERLVAVASQSRYDVAKNDLPGVMVYRSYEELVSDPEVEIVYISSTHNFHFEHAKMALESGKHVLCEKPMTTSMKNTMVLCQLAKNKGLFLMEAIWTRFLPAYKALLSAIQSGEIGEVKYIKADFSFKNDWHQDRRIMNKSLAGGSVYDVGIYNISLVCDILGVNPEKVQSVAHFTGTDVDESCAFLLSYSEGKIASCFSGIKLDTKNEAVITGTKGSVSIHPHWKPAGYVIHKNGKQSKYVDIPFFSTGYYHEIIEISQCIRNGLTESPLMTHDDSKAIAGIIDTILVNIGYK